jgi:two-component system sensor histidine kinase DegS
VIVVQIIEAQEEERRKISRQIHDGPAQALSNFILQTEIALRLFDTDQDRAREEMNNLKTAASSTFSKVRDFIFDLRPMMLDDLGLIPTVRRYVEAYKDKSGMNIGLVLTGSERRMASHREVLIFRTIQMLLGNAREHAQATQLKISLDVGDRQARVMVEDNGRGFDAEHVMEEMEGHSLPTLRDRLALVGGDFELDSRPGEGTRITFTLPVED